jgi:hypothetical protein
MHGKGCRFFEPTHKSEKIEMGDFYGRPQANMNSVNEAGFSSSLNF